MPKKYILPDNINFWDYVYNNDVDNLDNVDTNTCLLTNETLISNYIELPCKHKFNYIALYNEIVQLTCNNNIYKKVNTNTYTIYCPYCRKNSNGLLPYIPSIISDKIKYVNYPYKYSIKHKRCSYNNNNLQCSSNYAYDISNNILCNTHHISLDKQNNNIKLKSNMTDEMITYSNKYTIVELKQKLKQHKLKCTGLKHILIYRIFNNNIN
jgi:hypothetical protein